MASLRHKHWSVIAVLAATLVALTGLTAPAQAVTARTVSLKATPTTVTYGGEAVFAGKVTKSPKGSVVRLQQWDGSKWALVKAAKTTNAAGNYSLKLHAPAVAGTFTFRSYAPKTSKLAAATSAKVKVAVKAPSVAPKITTTSLPQADKGVAYSTTLAKTGKAGTWSISVGTLPAGITLNGSTGKLSGTPTAGGSSGFTMKFKETTSGLSATKALTLVVTPPPTITTATLPDATRGTAYSTTLAKTGKAGTWAATGLPAGLTINASTGEISGVPTVATGTYGVYPTFTETSNGRAVLKAFALNVLGVNVAITTPLLSDANKGAPYSVTLTKTGGAGTWSSLELPAGLTLDPATGVLSGTPTVGGDFSVYVGYTETSTQVTAAKGFALHIATPQVTSTSVADGFTGTAYSEQLTKTGLAGTWTVTTGQLPPGVTLDPETGLLAGTPTAVGDYGFTVRFTETSTASFDNQVLLLHVQAPGSPTITTTSLADATLGTAYNATLAATPTGGTWSITYGSLPVGLTLNFSTGAITGTPTVAEDALFIVKYTRNGTSNTKVLTLSAKAAPATP